MVWLIISTQQIFRFQSLPYCYPCQSPTTALPAAKTLTSVVSPLQPSQSAPQDQTSCEVGPKMGLEEVEEDQREMKHGHVMGQRHLERRAP